MPLEHPARELAMSSSSPILQAENVRRVADEATVLLDGVSLQIEAGSATAIVGPPGSGKSLLLRALGLLDPLQGGEVRFRGEPIADRDVPAFRRQVLYVQQQPILIEGSVRENLQLPFALGTTSRDQFDEDTISDRLLAVGREKAFLSRKVDDLSGGERQIVSLLRAIQLEPTVLLLDEPTSSLDVDTTAAAERMIDDWKHRDAERTQIIVTHTHEQAERLSDRRLHISGGRITTAGETTVEPA
jgi:putative ABC transport system ATP-binding protein